MSIRMASFVGPLLLSSALHASEANPLLGCWQCSSGESKMALRFDATHYLIIEDEPLTYRHAPGFIQIPEPDGYSEYPYRIENGTLTILMDDTLPLICRPSSCPAGH